MFTSALQSRAETQKPECYSAPSGGRTVTHESRGCALKPTLERRKVPPRIIKLASRLNSLVSITVFMSAEKLENIWCLTHCTHSETQWRLYYGMGFHTLLKFT